MTELGSYSSVRRPFVDPVKGVERELVVLIGPPAFDALKVEHGCSDLADVSADLDAWFCPVCHAQGRISGAWALDVYGEVTKPGPKPPPPAATQSGYHGG